MCIVMHMYFPDLSMNPPPPTHTHTHTHTHTTITCTHIYSKSPESSRSLQQQSSIDNHSLPQHTGSSVADLASGSPISLSVGPTPIPSPQPSHTSSQKSYRSNSPSKRRRNHSSGHVSSSSEETIRAHDFHSTTSLVSHLSSLGHGGGAIHPKVSRTEVRDRIKTEVQ